MSVRRSASALERLATELAEPVALLGGGPWSVDRLQVLLARSEFRAFQVERCVAPRVCVGSCPQDGGTARLAWARPLRSRGGALGSGAWIVGRALSIGSGRWVLIGRPAIVGRGAPVASLAALVASLRAPRGEFWSVHGAVIVHAARSGRPARPAAIAA